MKLEGTNPAPEFPVGHEWLNATRPVTLADLRGKIVLLDFWCFCCINCMHIIPELDQLERDFPDELVVIGVHSAKFDGEKDSAAVRQAMERYGIRHMVVNDADMRIWEEFAVHAWPSLVLIDPAGNIVARASGEHIYQPFKALLTDMVAHWDGKGGLDRAPLGLHAPGETAPGRVLSFPGKLAADVAGKRLFISDSGNHRIVMTGMDGRVQGVIGSGEQGFTDGPSSAAQFRRPQGMCFDAELNTLYIADTQNHAIRRADLNTMEVTTLAGDGKQASGPDDGPGSAVGRLASPWDIVQYKGRLIIAMAGTHQLWWLDPQTTALDLLAGNGRENMVDGPAEQASFSQPSGLAINGDHLYVADSENSAIRQVDLANSCGVSTVTGAGLFEFGDIDGPLQGARLQHCIGIACHENRIYIADSYNHKVKVCDQGAGSVNTLNGTGERGMEDGEMYRALFNEPNDLLFAEGRLFIADTNNHAIRVMDLEVGTVTTLQLHGFDSSADSPPAEAESEQYVEVPGGSFELELQLDLPDGTKLNPLVATELKVAAAGQENVVVVNAWDTDNCARVPATMESDSMELHVWGSLYYCDSGNEGLCYMHRVSLKLSLHAVGRKSASPRVTITPGTGL